MTKTSLTIALTAGLSIYGSSPKVDAAPSLGPTGNYYEIIAAPGIDWTSAESAAAGLGGHLATITSAAEDTFIYALADSLGLGQVWAGGYQSPITETTPTAGWTWINGEGSFSYTNWSGGEPNDNYGPGSEQYLGVNWGDTWNDEAELANLAGYVVEYESKVPDQGSTSVLAALAMLGMVSVQRLATRRDRTKS